MSIESLCTENDFSPIREDYRKLMYCRSEPKEKSGTNNNIITTQQKYRCKKRFICFSLKIFLFENVKMQAPKLMFT